MRQNTTTTDDEAVRQRVHALWAAVADRWDDHADQVEVRGAPVTRRLLERSHLRPGDRVLELACGPGGAGLAAARRVAPGGEVVLSDVVPEMCAIALARAQRQGVANVTVATLDLERIDQPDAGYDAVLCREGLMFAVDPAQAVDEIRRVLRPGGRAAVAVWAARERNPWLGLVFDAVTAETGMPLPPPGTPGPFSLADPGRLDDLFASAGFRDVTVEEVAVPVHAASFDEWWERTRALAGPLSAVLAMLPAETTAALTARLRRSTRRFATASGLELPGVTLVASARR